MFVAVDVVVVGTYVCDISLRVVWVECNIYFKQNFDFRFREFRLNFIYLQNNTMPLPPALLSRLAKRGIVDKNVKRAPNDTKAAQPAEEIIAEDYDDVEESQPIDYNYDNYQPPVKKAQQNFWSERLKRRIVDGSINGYKGCPNKYNIYHKCSLFCVNTFGDGIKEPSKSYTKRKIRLLRRYSLPKDWKEVYDEGM